jgi:voltage-gated potassium channel
MLLPESGPVSANLAGSDRGDLKSTTYEFFILAISILSITNLALAFVFTFESQAWWLVMYVDAILTAIFLIDFTFRLTTASTKRAYLLHGGGVFDFLGCLPGLRIFRLFRIYRAVRVIRRLGGPRVFRELRAGLASGTLYLVVFLGLFTLEFVGLLELHFEQDAAGATIKTAGDALWWGYVTATTVGYGDEFPVTLGGRVVGVVMLTVGVALFATFSGFLANLFLSAGKDEADGTAEAADEDLRATLRNVERLLGEQAQELERLRIEVADLGPGAP